MIFVAVGTQKFPFDRLLRVMDDMVAEGVIKEDVFAQRGYSNYVPKHYKSSDFISKEHFLQIIESCDIVVTHSGVASILSSLEAKKPVIVVPRMAKFGEHVDDHQAEIAEIFEKQNLVAYCRDIDELPMMIEKYKKHTFSKYISARQKVVDTVADFIETCKK